MKRAALFDMDRTLVRVNTGNLYMRWRMQRREARLRDVARFTKWFTQYTLGVIEPSEIVHKALGSLAGVEEEAFSQELASWYARMVRPHISEDARREVAKARRDGRLIAILSATTPYAAGPLAADLAIDHVLCSRLEVVAGRFTGKCALLCYGATKVEVAELWAADHGVDLARSTFYTDSVSDLPMLERVGEPRVINPDPRLRVSAALRGWPVERWR